ncbi:MAG: DUF3499 domain-containing protein [Propionibacterium sp.]|nr:DUF3499 domain-containing protein [Propionibacterium sp.]
MRRCSRTACLAPAVATLTYVYADSTAVLGPLALSVVPGTYDLCIRHAESTSVPIGWEVIRLPTDAAPAPGEGDDDLMALADAVRQIGLRDDELPPIQQTPVPPTPPETPAPPRLRVVQD